MTVDEMLSKIQKLKNENKIDGKTQIITFDAWKDEDCEVTNIDVVEGKIMFF